MPVVVFKLKKAINVDELIGIQNFEFRRKSTRQGKPHEDVIGCKIRGLKDPQRINTSFHAPNSGATQDDGTREIKIYGCEYRVPEQILLELLSFYGEVQTDIVEELFDDEGGSGAHEAEGTNRTGTYCILTKQRIAGRPLIFL